MSPPLRVLVVDDDPAIQRAFRRVLEEEGYGVVAAQSATEAEAAIGRGAFDICTLDLNLGEVYGLDLLPRLREWAPWMRVILVTAVDDVKVAMSAVRSGASDYLVKPCSPEQLLHAVEQQAQARRLEKRIESLESEPARENLQFTTANSSLMAQFESARQVAGTDATVLLLGESGTGKTALARAIHDWSNRSKGAFATVSCPSLSPELLASELFGHVRGAFTGATDNRQGRVQIADGGTLFLDEIGDMSLPMQVKILRALQERTYERVGSNRSQRCDVRIIAATHRNLEQNIIKGSFREDLFYRLNVFPIEMPPLRERLDDLPLLIDDLIASLEKHGHGTVALSPAAVETLRAYHWPGNVRELSNLVERLAVLHPRAVVQPGDLPSRYRGGAATGTAAESAPPPPAPAPGPDSVMPARRQAGDDAVLPPDGVNLKDHIENIELALIKQALAQSNGVVAHAAKLLNTRRTTLVEKLRKYGLTRELAGDVDATSSSEV